MGALALDSCFLRAEAADVDVVEGLADVEGYRWMCSMCGGAEGGVTVAGGRGRYLGRGDVGVGVGGGGVEVEGYAGSVAARVSWGVSWGTKGRISWGTKGRISWRT